MQHSIQTNALVDNELHMSRETTLTSSAERFMKTLTNNK